ncbi:hypothetical protein [Ectothiorhodospira lacustris]|uniref:hypothetical protein n=1 Tax=Ectothiorhodospira lacustris TaxID=2899127 RepID=UPI001EE898E4|nr:hypothetical protein [Ectothiorhodospira lacustris]MCG5509632.1 hypothetical protein [Ectothiorhodospira lacustris]MCG5521573.1 hypothetical protein [Ectothiorhodospira lacustris]
MKHPEDMPAPERLDYLRAWLLSGIVMPEPWRAWLHRSLVTAIDDGASLDQLLGLRPAPGGRTLQTQRLKTERDRYLRRAWRLLPGSPWSRSVELAARVRRYQSTGFKRDQERGGPPADDPVRVELFQAMSRMDCPTDSSALHRIVKDR